MTTINKNIESSADLEEIYLERERYLLNVDDLLEQILSDNITNVNMELNIGKLFSNEDLSMNKDDISADIDIPLTITSEFGKI